MIKKTALLHVFETAPVDKLIGLDRFSRDGAVRVATSIFLLDMAIGIDDLDISSHGYLL
ncbi:MAG: hypothetical protein ACREQW_22805 [Candidatus Binatia bacterium]